MCQKDLGGADEDGGGHVPKSGGIGLSAPLPPERGDAEERESNRRGEGGGQRARDVSVSRMRPAE